jgi:uncharacterized damage-inducible protein DinB
MNDLMIQALRQIFRRDLLKLRQEVASYTDEEKVWLIEKKISNSAGNLCLHLVGNLNTYIGAELGKTGYIRDRDLEFSQKGLCIENLTKMIDDTMLVIDSTLAKYDDSILQSEYPQKVFADTMTTGFFLVHLATHLNYHLGQVNYHRRLLDTKKSNSIAHVYPRAFC